MAKLKRKPAVAAAGSLIGVPVCVVLRDGSYYVGLLTDADRKTITLNGTRGGGRLSGSSKGRSRMSREDRLRVSGFLGSLFGGGGGTLSPAATGLFGAGGGSGGGKAGFWGMIWPGIKFGIGMIRTIMPLLGLFKI